MKDMYSQMEKAMSASKFRVKGQEELASMENSDSVLHTAQQKIPANDEEKTYEKYEKFYSAPVDKNKMSQLKVLKRKRKRSQHPLRELRLLRGYTLEELAELTELSPSYLSRLESGSRRLNADILQRISAILSCHPGELLNHSNHQNKHLANTTWKKSPQEQQFTPAFAQDLPLYALSLKDKETLTLETDHAQKWTTRPPEMYGVPGSFAFTFNNLKVSPYFNSRDHIFAHPMRTLTQGCVMLAITTDNQAFIGQFKGWTHQEDSEPEGLEMITHNYKDGNYVEKTIQLKREQLKSACRLIGSMEAS